MIDGSRSSVLIDWLVGATQTGLLACQARRSGQACTLATDDDPVAIEVAEDNALVNGVALGRGD